MTRPHALLRAGFPYLKTIGMRRVTNTPADVAFGSDGTVYVLCGAAIQKLSFEDDDLGPMGIPTGNGNAVWPVQMIKDSREHLYVSDEAQHRITAFTTEGELVDSWGEHGTEDGQLDRPSGIAFDPDENLLVSDTQNHRVQKFTKEGKFLAGWGRRGHSDGEFEMPWGIAVDELGDVYVSDWGNHRVQKLTADGEHVMTIGRHGSGNGEFDGPAGIEVDSDGDIYVADWRNDRVQQFAPDGRYLQKFVGDATLSRSARDYMINNARPLRLREMTSLEPQKLFRGPRSVRVDGQGRMFVPDFDSFRIQVYQKEAIPLGPDQIAPPLDAPTLMTT